MLVPTNYQLTKHEPFIFSYSTVESLNQLI